MKAITTAIKAACSKSEQESPLDFYIRNRFMVFGGRRCGRSSFALRQHLSQQTQGSSAEAAIKANKGGAPSTQRIIGYDPGHNGELAVESVFKYDHATGAFTLISTNTVERRLGDKPTISIDEWPCSDE
ncbi:hypothetical protein [Serratia sp. (in: enterobacteria)]|uniref:hypothetical protein n=1 Tax=Serratia sp. (in: enterobacteria) TaxID=616 RepID=UPI00398962B9